MDRAGQPPARRRLEEALGVHLEPQLLDRALTHRSYAYENGGLPTNERLEFLGDSVLGLVVTDALFLRYPDLPEGQLAKLRAAVVNMRALAGVARHLGLGAHLKLGRGEETSGGRDKSSILADTLEAIFGAVYLEHGIDVATELIRRLVDPMLESTAAYGPGLDWKTSLQELTATAALGVPEYAVSEEGPDHAKVFHATALVQGVDYGTGSGRSKKEAEQAAAAAAFTRLQTQMKSAAQTQEEPVEAPPAGPGPESPEPPHRNPAPAAEGSSSAEPPTTAEEPSADQPPSTPPPPDKTEEPPTAKRTKPQQPKRRPGRGQVFPGDTGIVPG